MSGHLSKNDDFSKLSENYLKKLFLKSLFEKVFSDEFQEKSVIFKAIQ